jgi:hypothetical protein
MSAHKTENAAFNATANAAESVRQAAVTAATTQTAITSAEVTYFKACKAAALANGLSPSEFIDALRALGQAG